MQICLWACDSKGAHFASVERGLITVGGVPLTVTKTVHENGVTVTEVSGSDDVVGT